MAKTTVRSWSWPAWAIGVLAVFEDEPAIPADELDPAHRTVRVPFMSDLQLAAARRVAA